MSKLITTPEEYFKTRFNEAIKKMQLQIDSDVEFYVVNMLCDFIDPSKFDFLQSKDPTDTPLAFLLKKALDSPKDDKPQLYKLLGDTSLYVSGYFQDSFNNKTFSINYYIEMGSSAYEKLYILIKDKKNSTIYNKLSIQFNSLVDVIAEIASKSIGSNNKNILAIYDRWNRTNSERLRKILVDLGIDPISVQTKLAQ